MKNILTLSIERLKEKMYIAFMLIVLNIIDQFEVLTEKFAYYVNQFKAAYNHLNRVYLKYDLKFYTEEVQKYDGLRTVAFRKLRDMVKYHLTYPVDDAKREAARILLEIINLYGSDIVKMRINERTAVLTNLIEDYEDKFYAQVEAIGVEALLADLRQAQDKFLEVYLARTEVDSELGLKAMAEARKRMTEAYRDLVAVVNLGVKRDTNGELTDFINMMNVEIRKQFINTGQSGNSASDEEDGDETVRTKTATFDYINGNTLKFRLAVGALIEVPENTLGYKWNPEVPEFMPEKNCTFKEVAIVPDEATAMFHFFDHREEEIRQLVGSVLHAPANTEGYVWNPEVPATMPAENTAYYEMPAEQQPGESTPTKYTIDFKHNGETVASYELEAGATVTAPVAPSGYHWVNVPSTMPAENVTVTTEEDEEENDNGGFVPPVFG